MRFFLTHINRELGSNVAKVEDKAISILKAHPWPGNVRELRNVLTMACLESRGSVLLADAVECALANSPSEFPTNVDLVSLDELEKKHILRAMTSTAGNLSAAARLLGVSRPTLRKRLKLYGLSQSDYQKG